MNKYLLYILFTYLLCSNQAISADNDNKFAVKGAGKRTCADFIQASKQKSTDYYLYGGWLEGYLSAYNQFQKNNFDVTPWQTTELLLVLLNQHCVKNNDVKFLSAASSLIKTLFPIRLKQEDNLVKIQVAGTESYYYQTIIERAKFRLKKLGYEVDMQSNGFTRKDAIAFEKFQENIGLKVTGLPNQKTLMSLFLKPTNN